MKETLFKALTQRIRKTLESGLSVAIIGWRDSNHNQFTRKIPRTKVVFFEETPSTLGQSIGYAIFTKFVGHPAFVRIKGANKDRVHSVVVQMGQLRILLESCQDLFFSLQSNVPISNAPRMEVTDTNAHKASPEQSLTDMALDFLTTPKEDFKMTDMDKFCRAFLEKSRLHKNKLVGKRVLARLRVEHGIKEPAPLLSSAGWIVPVIREGVTQIGWYKAGEKMLETIEHEKFEPEDPVERARFLIAKEPEFIAERLRLEGELGNIKQKLAIIESAKALLNQIKDLIEKK